MKVPDLVNVLSDTAGQMRLHDLLKKSGGTFACQLTTASMISKAWVELAPNILGDIACFKV